jgi:hypothetical protein
MWFMVLFPLILLAVWWRGALRLGRSGHAWCAVLLALGSLGFFGPSLLASTGSLLDHVELPAFFETTAIAGDGATTVTASMPFARIQRYDHDGHFLNGWFATNGGGQFALGLTREGTIALASTRTKQVEFFNPDGSMAAAARPFTWSGAPLNGVLWPGKISLEGVSFVQPAQVAGPPPHALTLLLFPFWHPLLAWVLCAMGMFCVWRGRNRNATPGTAQPPQA